MTTDVAGHDELREALGAHALGQLDAGLEQQVRAHLQTCDACAEVLAEITPVADALRAARPDALAPVKLTTPPELDERIRRALPDARPSPRRWLPAAAAAAAVGAAAAAAAIVTTVVVRDSPEGPAVIAVPTVRSAAGVTASAGLVAHTWGVEIKLQATGLPAGERFSMWVVGQDGRPHEAGQFVGVAGTRIVCDMSSAVLLADAASFRVVDADGDEVISGDMPS